MKSLIVLIFSFPSLVTVFCAHCREKEVFERVCSFPCHNWTRLALIFMMFWWYGRPAMRLISCITGIHSSFGWLTHNVGEFYAPSSGHRIHSGGIYFGNDRAVASRTQLIVVEAQSERSWRTTWHVSKSASHLWLDERARSSKPTTDQGCKHMAHERCGPRFVLRGTDFTKVAVSEVSPTVSSGRPGLHSRDTTEWWDFHLTDVKLSRSLATSDWMIFTPPRRLWHPVLVIRRQSVRAEPCAVQCLVGDERQNEN